MLLHWIVTLQWQAADGLHVRTFTGTTTADDRTRERMFDDVLATIAEATGLEFAEIPNVLFYSLEPNEMDRS